MSASTKMGPMIFAFWGSCSWVVPGYTSWPMYPIRYCENNYGLQYKRCCNVQPLLSWVPSGSTWHSTKMYLFIDFTRPSLVAQMVKDLSTMQERWVRSLGQEDTPGEGNGNPLQYSYLENSMDRGAWWVTIYGVAKSQT